MMLRSMRSYKDKSMSFYGNACSMRVFPYIVLVLLTSKKDNMRRMCMDNHAINKISMNYQFSIPHLDDMLDQLVEACIFSKIDFCFSFHEIWIYLGDELKNVFKTWMAYEWLIVLLGLSNAPNMFMRVMNHVLNLLLEDLRLCFW